MAPIPANDSLIADHTPSPSPGYWTKANIIGTVIFAVFALVITCLLVAFFIRRCMEKASITNPQADKAGLLANEDKTNMFSRTGVSSVTVYVDSEADARTKQESVSLIPLQVTPVEEAVADPIRNTQSEGSGISVVSSVSSSTQRTVLLSPISPMDDGSTASSMSGRPRSTSGASMRYYDRTPLDVPAMPVPIAVRTVSS